jgi:hypothetical protein
MVAQISNGRANNFSHFPPVMSRADVEATWQELNFHRNKCSCAKHIFSLFSVFFFSYRVSRAETYQVPK